MDWNIIIIIGSNLMIMLTFFGISVTLHLSLQNGVKEDVKAIHDEMKDFHGRLCAIEERRINK
jgi:hypothetical protein